MTSRLFPLAKLSDFQEIDTDDRSQLSEAYGESGEHVFPDIIDKCDHSPTGQHVYGGPGDCMCVWCRKPSGLDR